MPDEAPVISPMIVVGDGPAAISFYQAALGATVRWTLGDGQVACLDVQGAPSCCRESHPRPWGTHRQGGFTDPWGQPWLVGDRGPITAPTACVASTTCGVISSLFRCSRSIGR